MKKSEKAKKRTQYMCGRMLKWIRRQMLFDPRDMRETLGLNRRTYQDYEAGKRGIPRDLAARIREMYRKDREFMAGIHGRVDAVERKKGR